MAGRNRFARRVALCASLAIVALAAAAVPLKPAAADNYWRNNGHWQRGGYGHGDRDWGRGGYGGGAYFSFGAPSYYYPPPPVYYYPPAPVYYAPPPVYYPPAPVYGPPGISLDFVIPLHFR
jgi:hypothetical protein